MGSSLRTPSPSPAQPSPALAPNHEATLKVSASPSPVPPTPPPKDYPHPPSAVSASASPAAAAMSKLGMKAVPPELDDSESLVIDISGPPGDDPDLTLRADAEHDGHKDDEEAKQEEEEEEEEEDTEGEQTPRDSDATEADITMTMPPQRLDSPEHGGSTLYGSGAGIDGDREHVQEHPLRLDVHPPSPPPWDGDGDGDGDEGEFGGRSGRVSPQRYVFSGPKAQRMHEFGNKSRSHNRPLIPHSAYYFGPPPSGSAYGTDPIGQIGVHHPREIVRVERDYTGGELPQFAATYPLELEGRITPTQFLETINAVNELLLSAHSLGHAFVDNALAFFSLQITRGLVKTHYEKEMDRLRTLIEELNTQMYNPVGLHIKWPHSVAFLFLEIEYY